MSDTQFHRPIILMGSERSGTNLLASIFDAHPQYCAPATAHLLRLAFYIEKSEIPRSQLEQNDLLKRFYFLKSSVWRIDEMAASIFEEAAAQAMSPWEIASVLLQMERRAAKKSFIFIRENEVPKFLSRIVSASVEPRILHLVRNPKDHAVSWRQTPILRGGILRATSRWQSDLRGILSIISGLPGEIRVSQVRYEDLVQAPQETLRRVVHELNIEFSPALLEHQLRSWTASNNSSRNDGWKNISRSINSDSVGSSVHLTSEEIDFVEATCWELMSRFDYSINQARIDGFTPQDISALRTKLAAQEPDEKPQWKNLAEEQKERLQSWSTLFKSI